jgi:cytochrome c oxidase assembly protein subunit 11
MATRAGRNNRLAMVLAAVVCGMVALAFASVPLYRLFCQVTGFGGTTQVAEAPAGEIGERVIAVRFNADVNPRLPWEFRPEQREIKLRVGEQALAFYRAKNTTAQATVGTATFNVTPAKAGPYFNKVACFCFDEQRLEAGEEVDMGVSFFVDPAIVEDPNLDDVRTITLSYTFFRDIDDWEREQQEQQEQASGAVSPSTEQLAAAVQSTR